MEFGRDSGRSDLSRASSEGQSIEGLYGVTAKNPRSGVHAKELSCFADMADALFAGPRLAG